MRVRPRPKSTSVLVRGRRHTRSVYTEKRPRAGTDAQSRLEKTSPGGSGTVSESKREVKK